VAEFKYFGTTVTNQNVIQEEINACYDSVQNPLSSRLLSINGKIRIHKILSLSVVLHGWDTWSVTLRAEQTESVWEQRSEENIWTEEGEVTGEWRRLLNGELRNLYYSPSIIAIKDITSAVSRNNFPWCLFIHICYRYMFRPLFPSSGGI
jgi:hypothetical protein